MAILSRIAGTGSYLPEKVLTNADLEKIVDTSDEWIVQPHRHPRTPHRRRRPDHRRPGLSTRPCGRWRPPASTAAEIDLIVVGTTTPDLIFPSTACLLQAPTRRQRLPAFDVNAACSGFIFALSVADKFIRTGTVKNALVIGAETLTRMVDWTDRATCVLFGDGAGAVVLKADSEAGILSHPPACRRRQEGPAVQPGRRLGGLQARRTECRRAHA